VPQLNRRVLQRVAVFLLGAFPLVAGGQLVSTQQAGISDNQSFQHSDIDSVNLSNGNLNLHIPLVSFPQLGNNLKLSFGIRFNAPEWTTSIGVAAIPQYFQQQTYLAQWYVANAYSTNPRPVGVDVVRDQALTVSRSTLTFMCVAADDTGPGDCQNGNPLWQSKANGGPYLEGATSTTATLTSVRDRTGAEHVVGIVPQPGAYPATAPNYFSAPDGSGWTPGGIPTGTNLYAQGPAYYLDRNGIKYVHKQLFSSPNITAGFANDVTDPNGNTITTSLTGWTDSVGRIIPGSYSGPGSGVQSLSNPPYNGGPLEDDPFPGVQSADLSECASGSTAARTWDVPGANDSTVTYIFCYSPQTAVTSFGISTITGYAATVLEAQHTSGLLLTEIVLPNKTTTYKFAYDSFLELKTVTLPSGGTISYQWTTIPWDNSSLSQPVVRAISSRTVNPIQGAAATWNYTWQTASATQSNRPGNVTVTVNVVKPDGNDEIHQTMSPILGGGSSVKYYQGHSPMNPAGGGGTLIRTVATTNEIISTPIFEPLNPLPAKSNGSQPVAQYQDPWSFQDLYVGRPTSQTITEVNGLTAKTVFTPVPAATIAYENYGENRIWSRDAQRLNGQSPAIQFGQIATTADYDYGVSVGVPGPLLRSTTTTYKWNDGSSSAGIYLSANLLDLPSSVVTNDGAGHWAGEIDYLYDENNGSPAGGHGNLTTTARYVTQAAKVSSHTAYNGQGMPTLMTDANGNKTSIESYQCSGLFPKNVISPYQSTTTLAETNGYVYDCTSGEVTSRTDPNRQPYGYSYDDFSRLIGTTAPDGGNTQISYNGDPTPPVKTITTATGEASGSIVSVIKYDGLGRIVQSQLTSDLQGADLVDTTYDPLGRVASVSNPHRAGASQPSDGITSYAYDGLSRRVLQCNQDNGTTGACTPGASYRRWVYTAPTADFYDELGNHSQQRVDALGRLTIVKEPDSSNTPTYETDYTYNSLSNLINVNQKGKSGTDIPRVRTFTYDGLSRLVQAFNPETGWICYGTTGGIGANGGNCTSGYDANGNLGAKTDARGFTTTYQYDGLNRMTFEVSSAPNTMTHSWKYDLASVAGITTINPVGTLVFTGAYFSGPPIANESGTMYWNHDPMGRVLGTKICTPTTCSSTNVNDSLWYDLSNKYDLAGNPTSYTDGFHTTIASTYDGAGRLLTVTSKNDLTQQTFTLWTANTYGAVGLTQATMGNGVVNTLQYTNRKWLQSTTAKTTTGPVIYSEALTYYPDGNPQTVTDPVNGNWSYNYDTLNRLSTGVSTNTGQGCQFTYDPFGNRKTSAPYQGTCTSPHFGFILSATNHIDGYCYDGAGNLVDSGPCPATGSNHQYFYDGYNHMVSPNFNQTGRDGYVVDALDHRVAKYLSGTLARVYLYGMDGNPVAEMGGAGNWLQTNVHVGDMFLATYQGTNIYFQHTDHLGTIRAQSNSAGARVTACANLPFGDSLNCNGNANPAGYHFTGKERDTESGLDNFGARYYGGNMGRFMSPDFTGEGSDPVPVPSADFDNPQSLNLYSYVHNNPLTNVDPDGHDCVVQTRTSDTTESVSVSSGNCDNVKVGDGQTKTYVGGTVDMSSISSDHAGGINVGYTPYAGGGDAGVQNMQAAPVPDNPGIALNWGNNAQGYQTLGAADKAVTYGTAIYAGVFGSVGAAIAGGEIAAGTAAARSGIIFRLAHGMRIAAGHSQVLAETGAVKNAIAAAIASGAIQKMGGSAFQGVVQVAGTFIRFTGAFTANGVVVSNVMGQALQK